MRSAIVNGLLGINCNFATPILVGDIGIGVLAGGGNLNVDLGGASASTNDLAEQSPFGSGSLPSAAAPSVSTTSGNSGNTGSSVGTLSGTTGSAGLSTPGSAGTPATPAAGSGKESLGPISEDDGLREPRALGRGMQRHERGGADRAGLARPGGGAVRLGLPAAATPRPIDGSSGGNDVSEDGSGGSSKLRLSAAKANGRLLKGYGPLAALLVAFVLMAMLVPTKAPQQDVVHETPAGHGRDRHRRWDERHGGDRRVHDRRERRRGRRGERRGRSQGERGCGQPRRRPGTPARARGSRWPATRTRRRASRSRGTTGAPRLPGVSGNQINVTYRITSDSESFQQTLASLGGANIVDTTADIERTISALATYFDNHFQFYGRKLNVEYFNGQGSITNELLGSGQQQADADAVTAAQQLHAFAELNGASEPYGVALSQQHVVNFGVPYLSASFMGQYAPYMWSLDTESNDVVSATQELYLKSMAGRERRLRRRQPARASRARWRSSPRATRGTRRRRRAPSRRRRRPATRWRTTSSTS